MDIHPLYVGIDVSKAFLDIYDGAGSRCANTAKAITPLAARWAKLEAFVVLEATGCYDRALRKALDEAGVAYARVNPAQARDYARAAGYLAKTDQVDARMLAAMGQALKPRPAEPISPAREKLALLSRRRDQLVHACKQEKTRLKGCDDKEIAADLRRHIDWLKGEIRALEKRIKAELASDAELARDSKLLRTIPGIGDVTSVVLLALMPELGRRSGKSIAALAGLAPLNRDSGLHRGKRIIGGGRKQVRDGAYMAALAASLSKSPFRATYEQLRAAGKPGKLALIALARKILVTANAVLRDQRAYAG